MAEWAKNYVKHCGSMSEVRDVRDKNVEVQEAAIARIVELKKQDEQRAVSSILKDIFKNARNLLDLVGTIMAMLGAKASVCDDDVNEEGAVSGLMETQDGVRYYHSTTLSDSVTTAQHEQAEIVTSRNFQREWDQ